MPAALKMFVDLRLYWLLVPTRFSKNPIPPERRVGVTVKSAVAQSLTEGNSLRMFRAWANEASTSQLRERMPS